MINPTITNLVAAVTIVLLLVFSSYLLSYRKGKSSLVLLALFFLANTFYLIDYLLLPIERVLGLSLQWFDNIGLSFAFLFGPLILFFIQSIIKPNFSISRSIAWHLVPFVFFLGFFTIADDALCDYGYIPLFVHLFIYYFIVFFSLKRHDAKVKSFFSALDEMRLMWVTYVLIAFVLISVIDTTSTILALFHLDNPTTRANLNFFSVVINFGYAVYMFYKSLHLPSYAVHHEKLPIEKYSNSRLADEMKLEILNKTETFYSTEKPYLNPSLTISDVSEAIDVPIKSISQVINEFRKKNFYDFTNSYRIDEAKRHLAETNDEKETILEILYKSGFNTKSSFNTAFKKQTNLTPTQYRRNHNI